MRSGRFILLTWLMMLAAPPAGAEKQAKLYRWVDAQGKVHYSDTMPEEAVRQKRIVYDKSQLRKVAVLEKPKTPEELAQERRLAQLREAEKRLLAEQLSRDRALLRTYRSEEDLRLALRGQLNTIDTRIRVLKANRHRLQSLLQDRIAKAAAIERNGHRIPKGLTDEIASLRQSIRATEAKIANEHRAREDLQKKFSRDIARFQQLKAHSQSDTANVATTRSDTDPDAKEGVILSVAHCRPKVDCARAWQLVRIYVQSHATTPLFIDNDTILHTHDPRKDDDIALTAARIRGKDQDTLFLDVRCKLSPLGQELCHSERVRRLRSDFARFIASGLKLSPQ